MARLIDGVVFYSLLVLIPLVAIPYGTVHPWSKALFQCLVFALAGLSLVGKLLHTDTYRQHYRLFLPVIALIAYALVQTIPWSSYELAGITIPKSLSADPFSTWLFVLQLTALALVGGLILRHASSRKRVLLLIDIIIAVGAISACFGLLRQMLQREPGFVLPYLLPGYGYAQFVNSNHFAFLIEMALGLALGLVVCRGANGGRLAGYLIASVPMGIAVILSNSRGGILSILCLVLFLGFLLSRRIKSRGDSGDRSWPARASQTVVLRLALVLALLTAAVLTVVFVGGDPLAGRIEQVRVEFNQPTAESYSLRQNIWRATWDLIKDDPVAGVGFGGYWIAIRCYHRGSGEAAPQEAHSDYLELLAAGGVIGVAIGIWFLMTFASAARRKLQVADKFGQATALCAMAGILPVAVHSLVDFGLHITINAVVLTVLIGIVVLPRSGYE